MVYNQAVRHIQFVAESNVDPLRQLIIRDGLTAAERSAVPARHWTAAAKMQELKEADAEKERKKKEKEDRQAERARKKAEKDLQQAEHKAAVEQRKKDRAAKKAERDAAAAAKKAQRQATRASGPASTTARKRKPSAKRTEAAATDLTAQMELTTGKRKRSMSVRALQAAALSEGSSSEVSLSTDDDECSNREGMCDGAGPSGCVENCSEEQRPGVRQRVALGDITNQGARK